MQSRIVLALLVPCMLALRRRADVLENKEERRNILEGDVVAEVQEGMSLTQQMTCTDITDALVAHLSIFKQFLSDICNTTATDDSTVKCNFPEDMDISSEATAFVISAINIMDTKIGCLAQAFSTDSVQGLLTDLMQFLEAVLSSGSSEEVMADMRETYGTAVLWQHRLRSLAGTFVDRNELLPLDLRDSGCPSACSRCYTDRSMSRFSFGCVLPRKKWRKPTPQPPATYQEGKGALQCARHRWPNGNKYTCNVRDWSELAFQRVRIAALITCSELIMLPLFLGRQPTPDEHKTCLMLEQNMAVSPSSLSTYKHLLQERETSKFVDAGSAPMALLVFIGLAQGGGLAALRAAAQGNAGSLMEETPVDILAVFTQGFSTSGGSSMFIDDSGLIPQLECTPKKSVVEHGVVMGRGVLTAVAVLTGAAVSFTLSAVVGLSAWLVNLVVDFKGGGHGVRLQNVPKTAAWLGVLGGGLSGVVVNNMLRGRVGCEAGVGMLTGSNLESNICLKPLSVGKSQKVKCPHKRLYSAKVTCAPLGDTLEGALTWDSDSPCS